MVTWNLLGQPSITQHCPDFKHLNWTKYVKSNVCTEQGKIFLRSNKLSYQLAVLELNFVIWCCQKKCSVYNSRPLRLWEKPHCCIIMVPTWTRKMAIHFPVMEFYLHTKKSQFSQFLLIKYWNIEKNTGKVREICQSENVGNMAMHVNFKYGTLM